MSRIIRKSQTRSSTEAASLLASLFAAELICPSECLWLVSPWISDIQILDNQASGFDPLSRWGPRQVRLAGAGDARLCRFLHCYRHHL